MKPLVSVIVWTLVVLSRNDTQPELRVPRLSTPRIDGRIGADEWAGSAEAPMPEGGRVLMRHDGAYLYVAIRSGKRGFPSVCVVRGDTVRILHASAALADAMYVRAGNEWSQRQAFGTFAVRAGDTTAATRAAVRAFLDAHRWVASNIAMSGTEHEVQISLDLIDAAARRLALGYYSDADDAAVSWPTEQDDGCTSKKTVQGWLATPLVFRSDGWARLTLLQ